MTIHVRVPYRVVGLVVGPKGATIKRIQQDSQTHILTPSRDHDPIFAVTGQIDNVEHARHEIESYIALRTHGGGCVVNTDLLNGGGGGDIGGDGDGGERGHRGDEFGMGGLGPGGDGQIMGGGHLGNGSLFIGVGNSGRADELMPYGSGPCSLGPISLGTGVGYGTGSVVGNYRDVFPSGCSTRLSFGCDAANGGNMSLHGGMQYGGPEDGSNTAYGSRLMSSMVLKQAELGRVRGGLDQTGFNDGMDNFINNNKAITDLMQHENRILNNNNSNGCYNMMMNSNCSGPSSFGSPGMSSSVYNNFQVK